MGTSSQRDNVRGRAACVADVSPEVVDAGAEVTLKGKVTCSPACDLRGHIVLVKDQAGALVRSVELTEFDGEASHTRGLVVKAPVEAGEFTWWVVCPAVVKDGISYAEASVRVAFTVKPHVMSALAWEIPSTVVTGERFRMKVGLKCSNECDLTNRDVGIYDDKGIQLAALSVGADCWPGTTALHVAEVELDAPAREGLYTWSVRSPKSDVGIPHAEGSVSFGVRAVGRPDCLVTIETVDKITQTPLEGARVVMHPYKAVTDERGVAAVRVTKGTYKLFVSQTRFLTFALPVEVTSDMTARAELDVEPVPERN